MKARPNTASVDRSETVGLSLGKNSADIRAGTIAINGKIIIFEEGSKRGCCRGFFGFGQFVGIVRFRSVNGVSHFHNSS